ncbi:energy-coupling factor ABC transporter ATP-binding protein [Desulforamulus hydrothermalis]|uniref:ABC transporter ATP-binding protein n=1 Tax=Desulforamulus hydrothermalis Lam5 = DSM 18033 TaxID=1121428 RepID=K8E0Z4_9FIRM|nr:ATP-binding cassette domain-containing protein [Desulforamulus hydrothermalis]CCO09342.1 Energy-coupling factor transporter ATP-binding protein EcfA [Desulforamulus hydrothermalis Lam5 = DSM 18033]SHH32648.1 cobalt/nickel transport system ATP-binding protein [Desulforamulus hydrothermalis Lam5 = DSM 18033]
MSDHIFQMQDLYFYYPDGTPALQGVSCNIARNKKIALLGANGAGKSTFLLHLIGILQPARGNIRFNGLPLQYDRDSLIRLRSKVGYVFQDPDSQLFSASVWQEVSFGPMNLGLPKQIVANRVADALQATGTFHLKDKPTHFLSFGQKKLISIADILAMQPEMIIFDEPTAFLDPRYTRRILDLLDNLNQQGISIIMATHDVDKAYQWADTVFVMKEGRLVKIGSPAEIFSDDDLLQATSLEKPLILSIFRQLQQAGYISHRLAPPKQLDELIALLPGRPAAR